MNLVFHVFFIFLEFVVEIGILLKLVRIRFKQGVLDDVGESYPFFAINHKDLFEEIFNGFRNIS